MKRMSPIPLVFVFLKKNPDVAGLYSPHVSKEEPKRDFQKEEASNSGTRTPHAGVRLLLAILRKQRPSVIKTCQGVRAWSTGAAPSPGGHSSPPFPWWKLLLHALSVSFYTDTEPHILDSSCWWIGVSVNAAPQNKTSFFRSQELFGWSHK